MSFSNLYERVRERSMRAERKRDMVECAAVQARVSSEKYMADEWPIKTSVSWNRKSVYIHIYPRGSS